MSETITPTTRVCERTRCTGEVFDALAIATGKGGHKPVVLDPEPTTWVNGGRFRMSVQQPPDADRPHVVAVRSAGQAFGVRSLYRQHADVCGGGTGVKARSREAA